MGESKFNELGKLGNLTFVGGYDGNWVIATSELTRSMAIKKYGPVTDEVFGPRGGWKSVTFGKTRFNSRSLIEA